MRYDNDAKQMKFEVLLRVAQLAYAGDLEEKSDSIPYDIIPGRVARFRCCVYREREILRERVIWREESTCLPIRMARAP